MMNPEDLRTKSDDELRDTLTDLRKQKFNMRFQRASGQLESTSQVRTVRRDIARVKTIMGQRQSAAGKKGA